MKTTPLYHTHCQLGATFAEKHEGWNLVAHFTDTAAENHAVRNHVGIADLSHQGRLRLTGEDRAKFLHRLISNDVESLSAGQGNYAMLLTNRGKIIADMNIHVLEDAIGINTAPETTDSLFKELDKYIIADDVELSGLTEETGAIAVHGPKSPELVQSVLGITALGTLVQHHNRFYEVDSPQGWQWVVCVRADITGEIGYNLYTSADALAWLWERLMTEREEVQPIGWDALESLRIEAGIPRYGAELTDKVIPLEAELEHAINFEKGCYIGQEIVARMKYRGHPNRLLRGLEIHDANVPEQNDRIFSSGISPALRGKHPKEKEVGWITSATYSPTLEKPIALGYVRTAVATAGSRVQIETSAGHVNGTVVLLPFLTNEV